jgi:hypothetical protein
MAKESYTRHYEESAEISSSPETVFSYADDHRNFSSHMSESSWMMGGGSMETRADDKKFQEVGSHMRMQGKVFGIPLFLDEVVTQHEPPHHKEWQTVGNINLLVIDHYILGFEIEPLNSNSRLRVYIDYDFPKSGGARLLGYLLGEMYAKWCVNQMISGVKKHFNKV